MRSEDEEENDYEEDEEDEESMRDDAGKDEYDDDQIEGDVDVDGEEEDDEGEDDEGEDGDGEDDEEEEDDDDDDDDDEEEEDGDDEDDGGGDDDDAETADAAGETVDGSQRPSSKAGSPAGERPGERARQPTPPHLTRRSMFVPAQPWPPSSLTIEAVVGIPLPSAVHSIASSTCLSYLLTGGQDGHVRVYDFWASVNGGQVMTAQQRAVVGLGEGVHKAGVGRGWWSCEVEDNSTPPVKRVEPVYSLACEGDALWALAGSQSGPINLYSLRHRPGHLVHSLRGHTNVVSCLQLLPGDKGLLSGSWDGAIKEWDLNTGQVVRSYPTHGAQISSLSLRPITSGTDKEPERQGANGDALPHVSVSVGPEFFKADREKSAGADGASAGGDGQRDADGDVAMADAAGEDKAEEEKKGDEPGKGSDEGGAPADVEMADSEAKPADAGAAANGDAPEGGADDDDTDSLFDDDGGGEDEAKDGGSPAAAAAALGLGLALPGATGTSGGSSTPAPGPSGAATSTSASGPSKPAPTTGGSGGGATAPPRPSAAKAAGAASTIPLLSPAEYKAMSNDIMLTSSMDGQAVWLGDGNQVLAGRRNGTVDIWDVRKTSSSATSLLRTLRTPADSGPVSCIVAFPDGQHVATASTDNIRLWNTAEYYDPAAAEETRKRSSRPPFRIIAGHHGGTVSSMIVDPTSRFLISASGDRGWQGESTKVVLIHEVKW